MATRKKKATTKTALPKSASVKTETTTTATTKAKQAATKAPKTAPPKTAAGKATTKAKPAAAKAPRTTAAAKAPKPVAPKKTFAAKSDPLAVYRSKRDFGITPEPQGEKGSKWKKDNNPFFVIQKHAASRLHYDFRLEVDGVLKSWAVPKGPSMNPGDKRLAVETEDHPIDYADFEGIIPKDEYGGGTVIVWDAGPYRNLKTHAGRELSMQQAYERGAIEIWVEGKKIRGGFALIHSRMGDSEKNWLLIKMRDKAADPELDPVSSQPQSVMTGRTIEEVAAKPGKVWSSSR